MAMDWYLLNDKGNTLSGDEEINSEGFYDLLDSDLAIPVELYNYDLSQKKDITAIIEERMADTKLKTLNRHALVPIGTCKAGMYIKYDDRFWLIVGIVDNNGIFEKAVMTNCNYYLTWVNQEGKIVQRWANITSASQYNNGETTTSHYYVRTDQLMVAIPDDDESLMLNTGVRFIIDRRCKVYEKSFSHDIEKDTSKEVTVYRLTRADSVLYDYQDSGYLQFLVYQDEQRETDGYYVINNTGYWLCGKVEEDSLFTLRKSEIVSESLTIYPDGIAEKFTAKFYDDNWREVEEEPQWIVNSDFSDKLRVVYDGNSVLISTKEPKLVNKSFELLLKCVGYEDVSATIFIRAFI